MTGNTNASPSVGGKETGASRSQTVLAPESAIGEGVGSGAYADVKYRGWVIHYDPCLPVAYCDWGFAHDNFDGASDANDNRYGYAPTLEAAKREIDIREDEE